MKWFHRKRNGVWRLLERVEHPTLPETVYINAALLKEARENGKIVYMQSGDIYSEEEALILSRVMPCCARLSDSGEPPPLETDDEG